MAKNKSNSTWLKRHVNDHWVQEATARGYRSRAAYKLIEIDDKDHLLKRGARVVDLGSAPGSWSQVAKERIGEQGLLVALDLLPMHPLHGVTFIEGDFREDHILAQLESHLEGQRLDLVISDIAPNLSGNRVTDQARSIHLNELALDFAVRWLKPGGHFLVKVFQGEGYTEFLAEVRRHFQAVATRKPKASRDESRELYLLGKSRLAHTDGPMDNGIEVAE